MSAIKPGDLFVLPGLPDDSYAVEWLFVRFHPDDARSALIVPADVFSLAGSFDVPLCRSGEVITARCGLSTWFDASLLTNKVGTATKQSLDLVKERLAQLVRGTFKTDDLQIEGADFDPEYEEWMNELGGIVHSLALEASR